LPFLIWAKKEIWGLIFRMQPKLTDTSNDAIALAIRLPVGQRRDHDTGFHIEAFYRHHLTDYLSMFAF
jgi:hypothetical protein